MFFCIGRFAVIGYFPVGTLMDIIKEMVKVHIAVAACPPFSGIPDFSNGYRRLKRSRECGHSKFLLFQPGYNLPISVNLTVKTSNSLSTALFIQNGRILPVSSVCACLCSNLILFDHGFMPVLLKLYFFERYSRLRLIRSVSVSTDVAEIYPSAGVFRQ